ncbi:lymphocyte function-associated antigen 3 [Xenopus laevis]|uniref:Lymphocyte function-associated antigen 3 n=1 Tax=Xenopus laevis TaxID=8355 RepID=A0A8J0U4Y4_XENLA|nr:lymphocyte function-associated antigen 3 [Xenopus laevis]
MLRSCLKVLLLIVSLRVGRGQEIINKAVHESVTFNLNSLDGVTEITWKFGQDKFAELDDITEPNFYRLRDRANATFSPGSLTINRLQKEDTGTYTAEIQVGRKTITVTFILKVYDAVQRPHVICTRGEDPNTLVLHCHSPGVVKYQWRDSSDNIVSDKQNFTVTDPSVDKNGNVTCDAHNPGSSKSNFILFSSCDQEEKSNTFHFISVGVALLLLFGIGIVLWILYKKGILTKKCFNRGEEPETKGEETEQLNSPGSHNGENKSPDVTLVNIRKLSGDGEL